MDEIAEHLRLADVTPEIRPPEPLEVTEGYVSDLLSDVLANAPNGGLLVTAQVHMNVIAVCVHTGVVGVIFALGRRPEESVRKKAMKENVHLYVSEESAFAIVGQLYALGIRGPDA
jgi:hypothetical protein